jgi:hypothetical protein
VPLIVDAHSRFAERIRFYTDIAGMVTDGFLTTDAAYKAASVLLAQNPQITQFAIGRRANKPTLAFDLTPLAVNTKAYKVKLNGTEVTYTSDGTATVAEITAGLTTALTALGVAGVTITDAGTKVTLVGAAAGNWFSVETEDIINLKLKQVHADPGIAADMDAIQLENPGWYGVTLTTGSTAEIVALAAWIEANSKLSALDTCDTDTPTVATGADTGPGSAAKQLNVSNYFRSSAWFHPNSAAFLGAGVLGKCFPSDPGSETWKFKTIASVASVDLLTATHLANLRAKKCNSYTTFGGQALTFDGTLASGEFIDVIRFRDWLVADIQVGLATTVANLPKLPFTNAGIAAVVSAIRSSLEKGIAIGGLTRDVPYVIIAPLSTAVSAADKAARTLKGVSFSATLTGAIHVTTINGTVSV